MKDDRVREWTCTGHGPGATQHAVAMSDFMVSQMIAAPRCVEGGLLYAGRTLWWDLADGSRRVSLHQEDEK